MTSEQFLSSLPFLQARLLQPDSALELAIEKAGNTNQWFTSEFTRHALHSIATAFLDETKCREWLQSYSISREDPKKVGIIMAGNIPLVGFHDLFCVLASGHEAIVKLSDKDSVLIKEIVEQWSQSLPVITDHVQFTERLEGFDAVIATGSNNSSRYFEYYFKKYPHILRRNRNGVAVLTGNESADDLKRLAEDIFLYFGLGCRNVSYMLVPDGYNFKLWDEAMSAYKALEHHNKYKNNLEYNFAIYIINQIPHMQLGHLILKEDPAIASRIGSLHYQYYNDAHGLSDLLDSRKDEIQCVVSKDPVNEWEHISFGASQKPALHQYADGVDTMAFLTSL